MGEARGLDGRLREILHERGIPEEYLENALYLPATWVYRDGTQEAGVLVFCEKDFQEKRLHFPLDQILPEAFYDLIEDIVIYEEPHFQRREPFLRSPSKGEELREIPVDVLIEGYFVKPFPPREGATHNPMVEPYSPKCFNPTLHSRAHVRFIAKSHTNLVGMIYLPVMPIEEKSLPLLQKE